MFLVLACPGPCLVERDGSSRRIAMMSHFCFFPSLCCSHRTYTLHNTCTAVPSLYQSTQSLLTLHSHLLLIPAFRKRARQEHAHSPLILLVHGILARRDILRQRRAPPKNTHIRDRRRQRPVQPRTRTDRSPNIHRQPHRLLGRKVRVPRVCEETGRVEAAVQLGAGVAFGGFCGLLVGGFGLVVVPLGLVGEEFEEDEGDEEAGEGYVGGGHLGGDAGGEEDEVGGGCYGEEEDLGIFVSACLVGYCARVWWIGNPRFARCS